MAFGIEFRGLAGKVCRWLSANWVVDSLGHPAPVAHDPDAPPKRAAASTDFGLAKRLAAVARHNLPSSRPARQVKSSRHPIPAARLIAPKAYKETRLPTSFAVSTLTKPARASADIISLDAARRGRTQRKHRVAA